MSRAFLPLYSIHARGKFPIGFDYSPGYYGYPVIYQVRRTWHGLQQVREKYYKPREPSTSKQAGTWVAFHNAVKAWQELTPEEKEVYNKRNYPPRMSGYNRFLKDYLKENPPVKIYWELLEKSEADSSTIEQFLTDFYVPNTRAVQTTTPLAGGGQLITDRNLTIAGLSALGSANYLVGVKSDALAWEYKNLVGTTNQITVTHTAGLITLSLPQNIHTAAAPTFGGGTFNGQVIMNANTWPGTLVVYNNAAADVSQYIMHFYRLYTGAGTMYIGFKAHATDYSYITYYPQDGWGFTILKAGGWYNPLRIATSGIYPTTNAFYYLGTNALGWAALKIGKIAAPDSNPSGAVIYCDSADGDLKVRFANGTVKTIATD